MNFFKRLFAGESASEECAKEYAEREEWSDYNINYSDDMPNSGVYYNPDLETMRLVIAMSKATDDKVRNLFDHLCGVDISQITIRGVDENGEPVDYTIAAGATDDTDGDV